MERPDHQVVGIKPARKLLKFGEKRNNCIFFLEKLKAAPRSTEFAIETTVVATDQGKTAAEAPPFREVHMFH